MAKRRMAIMAALVCVCLWLMPSYAAAASTTEASAPIEAHQDCSLTLSYVCDGIAMENLSVRLYKIAEVSADFQYAAVDSFAAYGLSLNGIKTNAEWNVIRSTLETHITADQILPDQTLQTNADGAVCFEPLTIGLYLAVADATSQKEQTCRFDGALVTLPNLSAGGTWQYQVAASAKAELIPPSEQETERKVLKLWKGDEKGNRPQSIEVELFRDGISYKKILLSQENNWSYRWSVKEDGSKWAAVERNVPAGYTMAVEERGDTFLLTNTYIPQNPQEPSKSPDTGDTFNVMLYVVLMILSGSLLVILAVIGKRKGHEEVK